MKNAPFVDHVVPGSPTNGNVGDTSDSESTESDDDDDPDAARISIAHNQRNQSVSIPSKRVKTVARRGMKKMKVNVPVSTSPLVTTAIPPSTSIPPTKTKRSTRLTTTLRDESDDYTHLVSTIVDLKARVIQIDSLNAMTDRILKKLAARGFSSCRQDTQRGLNDDDDEDPNETQGGGERQIASLMSSASQAGDSTKNDWESEDENVEIEFEQDDEAHEDREEGEIVEEGDKEKDKHEDVNVTAETSEKITTCSDKKKARFKTISMSPPMLVIKTKYVSKTEAIGGLLSWFYDEKIRFFAIKRVDGVQ
ncbi:hypothetical protein L1987_43258 [Smallanthus sonchifolius]|uniref:Uncharacterized protein n=1 Tax=Smallanthus sonchifolius TaxID=185202 RepID=A0ACB9GKK6_9ASTR|nr:hypothetical protein L1987_43258 [Smallanthus sonchifolius]